MVKRIALPKSRLTPKPLPIVGWREWVTLPDLGVGQIKAKIDTGARTSALHAFDIQPFVRNGKAWVRFKMHPHQRQTHEVVMAEALVQERRRVRSSNGQTEMRPVILTSLAWLGRSPYAPGLPWPVELTLTNRDVMGFRLLLGRQALRQRVLVDVGGSFLQSFEHPSLSP